MSNQIKIYKAKNGNITVIHGMSVASYYIGPRMDGNVGLVRDGDIIDAPGLNEAVEATIADGQTRIIDLPHIGMSEQEHREFDASRKAINSAMTLNGKTY